ncbi:MAG TPA: molybdate ABC transporter permease subunit, partial [Thermoguttaceae bacterium]|nr:molybdate ABC transporter permease subunit [Thermoguttaceae bacterium]
ATDFTRHGFSVGSAQADRPADRPAVSASVTRAEWAALRLSFQVAVCAALLNLPFAIGIGYVLARYRFRGRWLVEAVVNLPLVLPPVVTGYLLLVCFAPRGPIGSVLEDWFGIRIVFTWSGAVLAAMAVSFPLMVRAVRLAFQSVDPRLEMAARSLGANRATTFFTVTLPLARNGVIAGWLLAFARSLGEFGATIMIAGNIEGLTRTIPLEIYSLANQPGGIGQSWRLVGLSILLACGALAVSEWLERRQSRHDAA